MYEATQESLKPLLCRGQGPRHRRQAIRVPSRRPLRPPDLRAGQEGRRQRGRQRPELDAGRPAPRRGAARTLREDHRQASRSTTPSRLGVTTSGRRSTSWRRKSPTSGSVSQSRSEPKICPTSRFSISSCWESPSRTTSPRPECPSPKETSRERVTDPTTRVPVPLRHPHGQPQWRPGRESASTAARRHVLRDRCPAQAVRPRLAQDPGRGHPRRSARGCGHEPDGAGATLPGLQA